MFNNSTGSYKSENLPLSYSDKYIGINILNLRRSPSKFKSEVLTRVLTLALPLFHLIDASRNEYFFLKAKLGKKEWVVQPSDSNKGLTAKDYAKLRSQHLKAAVTSIFNGMKNPASGALFLEKQLETPLPKKAITYELFPGSRLGDNVLCYFNAKWIGYKLGLPVLVKPFPHWNELKLSENVQYVTPNGLYNLFPAQKLPGREFKAEEIKDMKEGIYEVPFFASYDGHIDWTDEKFKELIQKDLLPINSSKLPEMKQDHINVAMHVRNGGDFDSEVEKFCSPTKIPKEEYYEKQIEYVLNHYKGKKIHFRIFTDAKDPQAVEQRFKKFTDHLPKETSQLISFSHQERNPNEDLESSTIQDMMAMSRYPCLIRSDSGLAKLSAMIGCPEMEIYPSHFSVERDQKIHKVSSIIDKVTVVERDTNTHEKKQKVMDAHIVKPYQGPLDSFIWNRLNG